MARRPVLLISLTGLAIDFLFMAFAPGIAWLLIGRLLHGATAANFAVANAYIADVTPPEQRAKTYGLLGSAFNFGFLVGPALGGFLGEFSLRLPFMVAAGLTLANVLYGLVLLPESLPVERRATRFDFSRANPLGALRLLRSRPGLLGLAAVFFLNMLSQAVLPSIFVLYATYRYGWSPLMMGATMAASGVAGVIVQILLVGAIVRAIGERGALLAGCLAGAAGFTLFGLAEQAWLYWSAIPVFAFMSLIQPGLMGLMTRRVGPTEQGQLQGANQSLQGVSTILGPPLFGLTFAWSVRHDGAWHMPGLAIFVAAALLIAAFALALRFGAEPQETQAAAAP
jgi:DHA1 family tetracycline resistance protein-like MFS transporter